MASYQETLRTLEEMRSRYDSGFSSSDQAIIEQLYSEVCGKRVRNTGCRDCWRDAYIETMLKLKQLGAMPKKANYVLKPGIVLQEPGKNKFYALNNCPDEVAERYLAKFPQHISMFEVYPTDWESRVKARKEGTVSVPTYDELKAEVEKLTAEAEGKDGEITALTEQVNALKVDLEAAKDEADALRKEVVAATDTVEKGKDEAQAEVKALHKENDELKAEVERLTAALEKALKAKAGKGTKEAPKDEAPKEAPTAETSAEEGK